MSAPVDRLEALVDELRSQPSETSWLEFKVNNWAPESIGKLVSAISNSARLADKLCGYIVWGIDNETHAVTGTQFVPGRETIKGQPFEFWLAQMISPSSPFSFKEFPHSQGRVVLLEIPAATHVTTKFNGESYIRIGDATPPLSKFPDREAALLEKLRPFAWEHGVAMSFVTTKDVMEHLDVAGYFQLTQGPIPGTNEGIMNIFEQSNLISRDVGGRWNILNVGAILLAKRIEDFGLAIARKAPRIVKYDGNARMSTTRSRTGILGYANGFEGLIEYVNRNLPHEEVVVRALREPKPIYPPVAMREFIANALIHQDMTITGTGPLIEIFADRVEVTNPGAPLVPTNRFIDYPPRSRNQTLATIMRRMRICEEQGSGCDIAVTAIELATLPAPDIREDGNNIKVTLFNRKMFAQMTQEERVRACYWHAVVRYVNGKGLTNGTLRQRLGVVERNAAQISRVINQAIEAGLIKQSEKFSARTGHYLPAWALP